MNVLLIWEPSKQLLDYFKSQIPQADFNIIGEDYDPTTIEVMIGWRPTVELLNSCSNLELFINPGAGVQHLIPIFRSSNITPVLVNNHGNAYYTAQHAVAMLLALSSRLFIHDNAMRQGIWRTGDSLAKSLPLRELNVGLLGFGKINQNVYRMLQGFDCKFSILKRKWEDDNINNHIGRFTPDTIDDFLSVLDALIVAVPLTQKTSKLLGKREFDIMKSNLVLINVARGDVIDQESFYNALETKKIDSAGIDVWYDYSPKEENNKKFPFEATKYPFYKLENVILSPHRGASPFDSIKRWDDVIKNLKMFLDGGDNFVNQVDLDLEY